MGKSLADGWILVPVPGLHPAERFLKESTVWSRNLSSFKNLLTVAGGLDRLLEDVLVLWFWNSGGVFLIL